MNPGVKSFLGSFLGAAATALLIPTLLLFLSTYFIPQMIEASNKTEALRVSRLKKALDIGEGNKEFKSRLNVLKTRMQSFIGQNTRGHLSGAQFREAQKNFQQSYTSDYLELDRMAWWWYWDLEREAQIFDLLSWEELKTLHDVLLKYAENIETSVKAISPLWEHLSSSDYRVDNKGQEQIKKLEQDMIPTLDALSEERMQLVKEMSALFAQSQHIPAQM